MKHSIIGTAGHVDHGKTALIQALTGTDTDRLPEEKRRGVTIELGFAHLLLDEETDADIIDVPGHERFIRNMLAGAGQVDIALMTVAADGGVMPQTIEHLEILELLGVKLGVVAITRCDLADAATLAATRVQLTQCFAGSFLEYAPVVEVCALTGAGLIELRTALLEQARLVPAKDAAASVRLPVDRIFTVSGFGTVITGVLLCGTLRTGDTVKLLPGSNTARVRNLQCHGLSVSVVSPGQRAAVNLAGAERKALARGCVLEGQNAPDRGPILCVKLICLSRENRAIIHLSRLHVHTGSGEALCRVFLWQHKVLAPGEECFAQLVPETPLAVAQGDRFVARFYSPVQTIGGGIVLETSERRYKASDVAWQRLPALFNGTDLIVPKPPERKKKPSIPEEGEGRVAQDEAWMEQLLALLHERRYLPLGREEAAARMGLAPRNCVRLLERLTQDGLVRSLGELGWLEQAHWETAVHALEEAFQNEPFTLAQYRDLLHVSRKPCQMLLEYFDTIGITLRHGDTRSRGPHCGF